MAGQEDLRFDKRLIDRNLRKGDLTYKDHAKHQTDLPDASAKAITLDEQLLLKEARGAASRMRERLKSQPLFGRRPLPMPTTSFEDEEYADITPEGASE